MKCGMSFLDCSTSYHITSYNTGPCFSMEERRYHAIYIRYGKILMLMKQYPLISKLKTSDIT